MKIEHAAFQVEDPVAQGEWYRQHLGLTIVRAQDASSFGRFLADDGRTVMLEFYRNPTVSVPDYRSQDPLVLHIAFQTENVEDTRKRLLSVGATPEGEVQTTPRGDRMAMVRDPWGMPIQLVRRQEPMIG